VSATQQLAFWIGGGHSPAAVVQYPSQKKAQCVAARSRKRRVTDRTMNATTFLSSAIRANGLASSSFGRLSAETRIR